MIWNATKNITVNAYSDLSYFPWIKYYTNASSYSFDNNISLKYSKNKWNVQAKYKFKIRQRNNDEKTKIINRYSNKLRFTIQGHLTIYQHLQLLTYQNSLTQDMNHRVIL